MSAMPIASDDTQPSQRTPMPTQPLIVPGRRMRGGGRCLLLGILCLTSLSMLATLALFILSVAEIDLERIGWRSEVTLVSAGETRRVLSNARSVGELLEDEGLIVPPGAKLSHPPDAALNDGMVIEIAPAREVQVSVDGQWQTLLTASDQPLDILESLNLRIGESDRIRVNGAWARLEALARWTIPASVIEILHPMSIRVIDGETSRSEITLAGTVGDALSELGISLEAGDRVQPPLDAAITADLTVTIRRATPIKLRVDGVVMDARVQAETVADALAELGAALFEADTVKPAAHTAISAGMLIEILRITESTHVEEERIDFQTSYVADASLPLDERRVMQTGQAGIRERRSVLRFENGVEVSRRTEAVIALEPRDQIIHYGANAVQRTVNTPVGARHYWRVLCMLATSYHPGALGGDDTTAIGWKLTKGIVAADPKLIPYRTKVFVPGYGIATMADTGGPRSSPYWIDLGYSDSDYRPWRKYVKVYLLTPQPAEFEMLLPAWTPNQNYAGDCGD